MTESLLIAEATRAFDELYMVAKLHHGAILPDTRNRLAARIRAKASHIAILADSVRDPGVRAMADQARTVVEYLDVPLAEARARFEKTGTRFYLQESA